MYEDFRKTYNGNLRKGVFIMYVNITGSANNKDVYIYQSYRKENGRTSSRIYKKLGKYNQLLERFAGDKDALMSWAREQARIETELYHQSNAKITVDFSQVSRIAMHETRVFHTGYLFLQSLCTELRLD